MNKYEVESRINETFLKSLVFIEISRDGPDIKSAGYPATGYPARQLSRIPDIRLAGYMAGYPAKPDIRPNRISGRPDTGSDIKFIKLFFQSSVYYLKKPDIRR